MAKIYKTPGIYIEEINAFPGSVVEVPTAIPAFIGYTEKASRNDIPLTDIPVRITSLKEYVELFGRGNLPRFDFTQSHKDSKHKITIENREFAIEFKGYNNRYFYNSIRFFYANGGGTCYIISVGSFEEESGEVNIDKDRLLAGLKSLEKEQEPTIIVVPDAVHLEMECYDIYKQVLSHCAQMQNRIAVFDIYDGYQERNIGNPDNDIIAKFRSAIGTDYLYYGAAYYPWLHTAIVQKEEITFKNIDNSVDLQSLLPETEAKEMIRDYLKQSHDLKTKFTKEEQNKNEEETTESLRISQDEREKNLHLGLITVSPTYSMILDKLSEVINLLPPSSAMAGIYNAVDNDRGVWKAPANVSLNQVIKPSVNITHDEQENLNVDPISGKSINAIRAFPGIGTLVWGARTLDGNSLDWKYINVRRTMIMMEQSIKLALRAYVFEPNDANTWVTVKSMIVNFLTEKWKQGALAGASPEDAFDVQIGLGSTMTSVDILEGKMLVTVKLAIVRPAEFIVVTFEQQMQKA